MTPQAYPLFTVASGRVYAVAGWDARLDPVLACLDGEETTAGWQGAFQFFTSEQAARSSLDQAS